MNVSAINLTPMILLSHTPHAKKEEKEMMALASGEVRQCSCCKHKPAPTLKEIPGPRAPSLKSSWETYRAPFGL